jgi:hypothetical protein
LMMNTNPTLWQASASSFATARRCSTMPSELYLAKSMIGSLVGAWSCSIEPMTIFRWPEILRRCAACHSSTGFDTIIQLFSTSS